MLGVELRFRFLFGCRAPSRKSGCPPKPEPYAPWPKPRNVFFNPCPSSQCSPKCASQTMSTYVSTSIYVPMSIYVRMSIFIPMSIDRLRVGWLNIFFREGFRETRRCSRDTYPESYITEYTPYTKTIFRCLSMFLCPSFFECPSLFLVQTSFSILLPSVCANQRGLSSAPHSQRISLTGVPRS